MKPLRAAAVQFNHRPGDKEWNLERIEQWARTAAGRGVDLLVFPEMCITGYWHVRRLEREDIERLAEPVPSGPSCRRLLDAPWERALRCLCRPRHSDTTTPFLPLLSLTVYGSKRSPHNPGEEMETSRLNVFRRLEIRRCSLCGTVTEILGANGVDLVCCGRSMVREETNVAGRNDDAHAIVVTETPRGLRVSGLFFGFNSGMRT